MDPQRVEELHRQASEHYLRGRFEEAAKVWGEVLRLEPQDERAREGLALAREMAQAHPDWDEALPTPEGPDQDLEQGLAVLDRLAPGAGAAPALVQGGSPEPLEAVETIPLAWPVPRGEPRRGTEASLEQGGLARDESIVGPAEEALPPRSAALGALPDDLAAVEPIVAERLEQEPGAVDSPCPAREQTPARQAAPAAVETRALQRRDLREPPRAGGEALAELQERVRALLEQARRAGGAGEVVQALDLVARVLILDEENQEALALEQELRQQQQEEGRRLEEALAEGIEWLEQGRLEDAIGRFEEILARHPGHREARAYLERARAQSSEAEVAARQPEAAETSPLHRRPRRAEPAKAAGTLDEPPPPPPRDWSEAPKAPRRAPRAGAEPRARGRRFGATALLAVVLLLAAGAGGLLLVSGGLPLFQPHIAPPAETHAAAQRVAPELPETLHGETAPQGGAPADAERGQPRQVDLSARLAAALARAHQAERRGDYAAAVLAYDEVLDLDPLNLEAREGLRLAGERYRERKEIEARIAQARAAFAEGDYAGALRVFYRLPDNALPQAQLARYKANGWYNLAVMSLRAGDTSHAREQLEEALGVRQDDEGSHRLRAFAERYEGRTKDAAYYEHVYGLALRALED